MSEGVTKVFLNIEHNCRFVMQTYVHEVSLNIIAGIFI